MNMKQIDCVLELSQTLNFRRAAEHLYISQPSLTYQVQSLEAEIGFLIFERSGKGAVLTPAGKQFCHRLHHIKKELQTAVEQGQNMSSRYTEGLNLCIPFRASFYLLPQVMRKFAEVMPKVALNIAFIYENSRVDSFLRGEHDILFAGETELNRFPNVKTAPLFESRFYLVVRHDDLLAGKKLITEKDLSGRTFIIGGDSPPKLTAIQNRILNQGGIETINSHNLNTALTYVAAGMGICVAPGISNDHNGEFAWIPFDCPERMDCVLGYHKDDRRESTRSFIRISQAAYQNAAGLDL